VIKLKSLERSEACSTWGEEKCMQSLVRKPEVRKLLGGIRYRWKDNIKFVLNKRNGMIGRIYGL
jgi:hypothetical protein